MDLISSYYNEYFYNTCFADPWITVAKELLSKHEMKPVYWIGYDDDNSEELVKQNFPRIVYHKYFDAWKGIFPEKTIGNTTQLIDIDFLKDYSSFELQALRMMDRMDSDQHSFSVIERQRHFRNLLRHWNAVIENLKPEALINAMPLGFMALYPSEQNISRVNSFQNLLFLTEINC